MAKKYTFVKRSRLQSFHCVYIEAIEVVVEQNSSFSKLRYLVPGKIQVRKYLRKKMEIFPIK